MSKKVYLNNKSKKKFYSGIKLLCDSISPTLGPSGKTVMLLSDGIMTFTKDGATVAKNCSHEDPLVMAGIIFARQSSSEMNKKVGDGTTSVNVLCYNLLQEVLKEKLNVFEFIEQYEHEIDNLCHSIKVLAKKPDNNSLYEIAYVSSNGDDITAANMVELFKHTQGTYGFHFKESFNHKNEVEIIPGFVLDCGLASPEFANKLDGSYQSENVCTLALFRDKCHSVDDIKKIAQIENLERCLVIAEDFNQEVFSYMKKTGIDFVPIKHSLRNEEKRNLFKDVEAITGAESFVNYQFGRSIVGSVFNVSIDQNSLRLLFIEPNLKQKMINDAEEALKEAETHYKTSELKKRLTRLKHGTIVYHYSAPNEIQIQEYKDRIDDAFHACKTAYHSGVVPCGNQLVIKLLPSGYRGALISPFGTICKNTNNDFETYYKIISNENKFVDFRTGEIYSEETYPILDPAEVVIEQYKTAFEMVKTILNNEIFIIDEN